VAGHVGFSDDGRLVAVPRATHLVGLLETRTWKELATLEAPQRRQPLGIAFSPDGTRLAVAHIDTAVHLWDLGAIRRRLAALGLAWGGAPGAAGDATGDAARDAGGAGQPLMVRVKGQPAAGG
jgi:hypothetical protein